MTAQNDILTNATGDLMIEGGDFVVGTSDQQHILHIMQAAPGHYKQHPMIGANAVQLINGSSETLKRQIKLHLLSDGYSIKKMSVTNGKVNIEI